MLSNHGMVLLLVQVQAQVTSLKTDHFLLRDIGEIVIQHSRGRNQSTQTMQSFMILLPT